MPRPALPLLLPLLLALLPAAPAPAAELSFKEIFDPFSPAFPVDGSRTERKQKAFDRAAADAGPAKVARQFRGFEKAMAELDKALARDHAAYMKISAEWWGWRRKYEQETLKKLGRLPAEYPIPPALNQAFLDREKQFRATRSLKLRERLFQEWAVARTGELALALDEAGRAKAAASFAAELRQRNPYQRLRAVQLLDALGAREEIDGALKHEGQPGVLAALAAAASWEAAAPLLQHADWRVRAGAIRAARRARSREAVAALLPPAFIIEEGRLLDDRTDALRDLTGQEIGTDDHAWQEWWKGVGPGWSPAPAPAPPSEIDRAQAPGVYSDGGIHFLDVATRSQAIVWCLDASIPEAWEELKARAESGVRLLPEGSRFGVVVFAGEVDVFRKKLVEANESNRQALASFLGKVKAGGGADLWGGLSAALDLAEDGADTLFLTAISGPRSGLYEDPRQVALEANVRNALLGIRIHTFGRSEGAESFYLQELARPFGGTHK